MSIIPGIPMPAYPGRRWQARHYPGTSSVCTRFRAELRSDLHALAGIPRELCEDIELCASEAFANAATHTRSQRPGSMVVRLLSTPLVVGRETTVRLSILDDGPLNSRPMCPLPRRSLEEWEEAESGRGLLFIHRLATEWGTQRWADPIAPAVSGTVLWAEFTYPTPTKAAVSTTTCVCGGGR